MGWAIPVAGAAISAASSVVGGITNSKARAAAARSQREWGQYNSLMGFQTSLGNIAAQTAIVGLNTSANLSLASLESASLEGIASYNASATRATAAYNAQLLGVELTNLWDAMDLDLLQLEQERAKERGSIRAHQAASGTVMDVDSNKAVLISQATQEKLDALVIRHGADIEAARIKNAMVQGLWQGEVAARQTEWEGRVRSNLSMANAQLRAIGDVGGTILSGGAQLRTARSELFSGMAGAEQAYTTGMAESRNYFTQGLFQGASTAIGSYYQYKPIGTGSTKLFGASGTNVTTTGGISTPGISLATG